MSGTSSLDSVLATVSTGSGKAQEEVTLSSASGISGTYVPVSPAGSIGASPLAVYNWDPATQLSHFLGALAAGQGARIVTVGDSTTLGFGSAAAGFRSLSYPAELAQALSALGVSAQSDNFLGQGNENGATTDERVSLSGGAAYIGWYDAGGQVIETTAAGQAISFTLDTPAAYNQLSVSYIDLGSGSATVSVDGVNVGTVQFGNTGNTLSQTIAIPAGLHGQVTLTANSANPTYIQGLAFSNSTSNQVQVFNAAIGGWGAGNANTSVLNGQVLHGSAQGFGQVAGTTALSPNLALIDLGLNDITGFTNAGAEVPTATIVLNLEQIIATYRAAGCDVILVIPHPFSDPSYAAGLPALRAALDLVSLADNVPIIDLSATYGDNFAALAAAGLMSDNLHPDATLYADIGTQIADLLANAINGTTTATDATVQGNGSNDTLSSSAANSELIGDGGNDSYNVAAGTGTTTTIINGASTSTGPAGTLNFSGLSYDQLWFTQSGNDLVISVLGTSQSVVVQNWFLQAGSELSGITTADGTLPNINVATLTAVMQGYLTLNPSFNPATSTAASLLDSIFTGALGAAVLTGWNKSGDPPCFCRGTLIATPRGTKRIEMLKPGDEVLTKFSGPQRIKFIGRRAYEGSFIAGNIMALPIRIAASAIARGVPARDLWLSPGHALWLGGALVPAWRLINGVSITQAEAVARVSYYHIELAHHDVIFAESCPAESFRETAGLRNQFQNASDFPRPPPGVSDAVKPLRAPLTGGRRLAALQRRINYRAGIPAAREATATLRGFIDEIVPATRHTAGHVSGWAQDTAQPDVPVTLGLYAGGKLLRKILANHERADLRQAGLGRGAHGFTAALPRGTPANISILRLADGAPLAMTDDARARRAARG